jgi:glutamate N-acetyltransferase/amino-acid N-acetyltransferase
MNTSPLLSILQCLRLSDDERGRLLIQTEVPSQVVAVYLKVAEGEETADAVSVILDEISEFGELIRINPDPAALPPHAQTADFLVVAIIPISAAGHFAGLFNRPSIVRHVSAALEDRAALKNLFAEMDLPVQAASDENPEELLDRARSFILSEEVLPAMSHPHEPLPASTEEHLAVVTLPKGYRAAGMHCGIKAGKNDLGLLISDRPAAAAGRFTKNRFCSGPVILCREHLEHPDTHAVVVNSGVANAATGERGLADARRMAELAAGQLGLEPQQVLVCSTGVIGRFLPMDKIESGIGEIVNRLTAGEDQLFVRAIMTTDTVMKYAVRQFELCGKEVSLGGVVKGAGMIAPNMATMLAFLTTDAAIRRSALDQALGIAVQETFNRLTVDGDTSTSDSVLLLANGAAGNEELRVDHPEFTHFVDELRALCEELVRKLARDGEGATHLVRVVCQGAFNTVEAVQVAKAIANSLLVKTAVFGRDPNWGRIIMAVGNSSARFDPSQVRVWLAGILLFERGLAVPFDKAEVSSAMGQEEVEIRVDLGAGPSEAVVYTCDISYDYVRINADYTT